MPPPSPVLSASLGFPGAHILPELASCANSGTLRSAKARVSRLFEVVRVCRSFSRSVGTSYRRRADGRTTSWNCTAIRSPVVRRTGDTLSRHAQRPVSGYACGRWAAPTSGMGSRLPKLASGSVGSRRLAAAPWRGGAGVSRRGGRHPGGAKLTYRRSGKTSSISPCGPPSISTTSTPSPLPRRASSRRTRQPCRRARPPSTPDRRRPPPQGPGPARPRARLRQPSRRGFGEGQRRGRRREDRPPGHAPELVAKDPGCRVRQSKVGPAESGVQTAGSARGV
jgi:hypothetical protein